MTATIPTSEPRSVIAGDTIKWNMTLSDYPASEWSGQYVLFGPDGSYNLSDEVTNTGDTFNIVVPAGTSGKWTAGTYKWQFLVTKAGERYAVREGTMVVEPNPGNQQLTSLETRSFAKQALDAIEAVLKKTASHEQESMSIDGVSLSRRTPEELWTLRSKLKAEYRREQQTERLKQGLTSGNKVKVRFK